MSDKDINKMDFKELRKEVQSLRDELAKMKRSYEDILYNLDYDNFSSRVLKDKNGMQTSIKQTAEAITLQAEEISKNDEYYKAQLEFTAQGIASEAEARKNKDEELSSRITQTAEGVETTVKNVVSDTYIKNALGDEYVTNATFESHFDVYADGIYATVEETYETKFDANSTYNSLSGDMSTLNNYISSVSQTAEKISTRVSRVESGQYVQNGETYTLFEQTADKFAFTGSVEISGDSIVGGTIIGSALQNSEKTHTLKMMDSVGGVGDYGTFRLYNNIYESVPYFSIYDNTLGAIYMYTAGENFLHVHASGTADGTLLVEPKGTWDFQNCIVKKLDNASTGGTATAVFG